MLSSANLDGIAYFVLYLFGGAVSFIIFIILGIWLIVDKIRKIQNRSAAEIKIIFMFCFFLITLFFLAKTLNIE